MTHDPGPIQTKEHSISCRNRQTGGNCTCGRNRGADIDFDYYKVGGVTPAGFPEDPRA